MSTNSQFNENCCVFSNINCPETNFQKRIFSKNATHTEAVFKKWYFLKIQPTQKQFYRCVLEKKWYWKFRQIYRKIHVLDVSLFNKVSGLKLIKRRLHQTIKHRCFSVNFCAIFKKNCFLEHLQRSLLLIAPSATGNVSTLNIFILAAFANPPE